jgi:competence protein ComEA
MKEPPQKYRTILIALVVIWLGMIGYALRRNAPAPVSVFPADSAASDLPPLRPVIPPPASLASRSPAPVPSRSSPAAQKPVIVHVAGAVQKPGVYFMLPGKRWADAITTAGGLTPEADPNSVNLASPLLDGQQILVRRKGEPRDEVRIAVSPIAPSADRSGKIAVNAASTQELIALPGVGPALAQKIVDYRTQYGPFRAPEDLLNVPGIGPKKLEKMEPYLQIP